MVSRFGMAVTVRSGWHVRIAPGALRAANARLSLVLFEDPPDPKGIYRHGDPAPFVRSTIRELNGFVRSLRIARGDFFPGTAPPARFQPAAGWHTRHSPTLAVSPSTYSIAIASTVPYRDCLDCFPPHDTVVQMRPED